MHPILVAGRKILVLLNLPPLPPSALCEGERALKQRAMLALKVWQGQSKIFFPPWRIRWQPDWIEVCEWGAERVCLEGTVHLS
jgi:hypothetical protein